MSIKRKTLMVYLPVDESVGECFRWNRDLEKKPTVSKTFANMSCAYGISSDVCDMISNVLKGKKNIVTYPSDDDRVFYIEASEIIINTIVSTVNKEYPDHFSDEDICDEDEEFYDEDESTETNQNSTSGDLADDLGFHSKI